MSDYAEQREKEIVSSKVFSWEQPLGTKCDRNIDTMEGDVVNSPSHYKLFSTEAIEIIASSMTREAFEGYCLGNHLKYRLRLGAKGRMEEDFQKSEKYKELFEKYNHLCKDSLF